MSWDTLWTFYWPQNPSYYVHSNWMTPKFKDNFVINISRPLLFMWQNWKLFWKNCSSEKWKKIGNFSHIDLIDINAIDENKFYFSISLHLKLLVLVWLSFGYYWYGYKWQCQSWSHRKLAKVCILLLWLFWNNWTKIRLMLMKTQNFVFFFVLFFWLSNK